MMKRRLRVRHSYPDSIVQRVLLLEPVYGTRTLSNLLDIPRSVIYRWRATQSQPQNVNSGELNDELLKTLVEHCKHFGFCKIATEWTPASSANDPLRPLKESTGNAIIHPTTPITSNKTRALLQINSEDFYSFERPTESKSRVRRVQSLVRSGKTYTFGSRRERLESGVRKRLESVRDVLANQYFLDLDCRTLSRLAGMSVHHFVRVFGDLFGVSPHQYLNQTRIEAAKRLLLASDEPIEVIAVGVGFRSGMTLNRVFRRVEGKSVSSYCKTMKKESRLADPSRQLFQTTEGLPHAA